MKNLLFLFWGIIALAATFSMSACDFDDDDDDPGYWIIDWTPVELSIQAYDKAGHDLLDPENPDNVIDGTKITFRGDTFPASREWYEHDLSQTRMYLPTMHGLWLVKRSLVEQGEPEGYKFLFGEIDGADDMDEDLVITWPNGKNNVIHYHCSDHTSGKNATCKRWYMLDGEKLDKAVFRIEL